MMGFASDLLRLASILQNGDTFCNGPLDINRVNLSALMEVAVQLLPHDECEFLDETRQILNYATQNDQQPTATLANDNHDDEIFIASFFLNPPNMPQAHMA
jgi:hypothetical protein